MRIFKYNKIINTTFAFEHGRYKLFGSRTPPERGDLIKDVNGDYHLVVDSIHARYIPSITLESEDKKKRFGYVLMHSTFISKGRLVHIQDIKKVALVVEANILCSKKIPCKKCGRRYSCLYTDTYEKDTYRRFLWE